ncbi:MAG: hypothetical protein KA807_13940 [Prolixibacteraceae bacterium]|nr:hypothetical protein [Prolixibacteraceae bacterium]
MKKTQPGWVSVAIIFLLDFLVIMGNRNKETIITMTIISVILLLIMGSLTLSVDSTYIRFYFGIGLIKGKFLISDVVYCRPVSFIPMGFGIRLGPGSILYNVNGTKAIELSVRGKDRIIRIGTDYPEEFTEYIYSQMKKKPEDRTDETFTIQRIPSGKHLIIIVAVIAIVATLIITQMRDSKVTTGNENIKISGIYGLTISYKDILSADTTSVFPPIEIRTNGFYMASVCKGHFKLKGNEKALLSVNLKYPPFIAVKLNDGRSIYFNSRDSQKTKEYFNDIKSKVRQ